MPRPQDNRRLIDLPQGEFNRRIARKGVGGTDIGPIIGISRWDETPQSIWEKKMGLSAPTAQNVDMRRGKVLERVCADEYELATGRVLRPRQKIVHPEYPWAIGSPDREIVCPPAETVVLADMHGDEHVEVRGSRVPNAPADGHGIIEIKALRLDGFYRMREEGIHPAYYCQLQWYLGIAGYQWGAFALFNAEDWAVHEFDVLADPEFFEWMRGHAEDFWNNNVLTRTPPDGLRIEVPAEMQERMNSRRGAETVDVEHLEREDRGAWNTAITALISARAEHALAERRKEMVEERVKRMMEEQGHDGVRGFGASITYREQSTRRLDRDALAEAHPELDLTPFMRASVSRPFRVTLRGPGDTRRTRGASTNPERPTQVRTPEFRPSLLDQYRMQSPNANFRQAMEAHCAGRIISSYTASSDGPSYIDIEERERDRITRRRIYENGEEEMTVEGYRPSPLTARSFDGQIAVQRRPEGPSEVSGPREVVQEAGTPSDGQPEPEMAGLRGLEGVPEESHEIIAARERPDGLLPADGDEAAELIEDIPRRPGEGAITRESVREMRARQRRARG